MEKKIGIVGSGQDTDIKAAMKGSFENVQKVEKHEIDKEKVNKLINERRCECNKCGQAFILKGLVVARKDMCPSCIVGGTRIGR